MVPYSWDWKIWVFLQDSNNLHYFTELYWCWQQFEKKLFGYLLCSRKKQEWERERHTIKNNKFKMWSFQSSLLHNQLRSFVSFYGKIEKKFSIQSWLKGFKYKQPYFFHYPFPQPVRNTVYWLGKIFLFKWGLIWNPFIIYLRKSLKQMFQFGLVCFFLTEFGLISCRNWELQPKEIF